MYLQGDPEAHMAAMQATLDQRRAEQAQPPHEDSGNHYGQFLQGQALAATRRPEGWGTHGDAQQPTAPPVAPVVDPAAQYARYQQQFQLYSQPPPTQFPRWGQQAASYA